MLHEVVKGNAVASGKSVRLVGVGVLVVLRVQPLIRAHEGWIGFRKEAEGRKFEETSRAGFR